MMPLLRDADAFQDTPFTTKCVTSAQPTTSFKITTVWHAQLNLFTIPLPKSVIVHKDSFWVETELALKSVPTIKSIIQKMETAIALQVLAELKEYAKSAQLEPPQSLTEIAVLADLTNN
jgi:hypothetical protein